MTTDLTVANTIAEQIGNRAFIMMGTTQKVGDEKSLMFNIRGTKFCNKIRVTLNASDLYDVEFIKIGRAPGFEVATPGMCFNVYAEDLRVTIEEYSGLRLAL